MIDSQYGLQVSLFEEAQDQQSSISAYNGVVQGDVESGRGTASDLDRLVLQCSHGNHLDLEKLKVTTRISQLVR